MALLVFLAPFALWSASACESHQPVYCDEDSPFTARPSTWTEESHCAGHDPDYGEVFDDGVVHRFDIVISAEDDARMTAYLDDNYRGGVSGDLDALPTPIWVPATVRHDGSTWTQVGFRYKGHASLRGALQSGKKKLSFILDFDHYEYDHPELDDQRFFGFTRLAFSSGYNDPSRIRERLAGQIFSDAGIPSPRRSFAAVYLDRGEGSEYLGLYTIVEDPCDTMLRSQFGDPSGHLYKPWGRAARWLDPDEIGQDEIVEYFDTCSAEDTGDRSEVVEAIERLHADRSDPEWRANLDEVFDVDSFLRTLAVNRVMMNWDSYGCMNHNYFVYALPTDELPEGLLTWFPWDLNEAMMDHERSGCPSPGSVMLDEIVAEETGIDADWPLIQVLLADEAYRGRYRTYLQEVLVTAFDADTVIGRMREYHDLVAPWIDGTIEVEEGDYTACEDCSAERFEDSLTTGDGALEPLVAARHEAVEAALAAEE
jgi:hypothetical protein